MSKPWARAVVGRVVLLGIVTSWGCGGISSNTLKARNAAAQQCAGLPIEQQPACARQLPVLRDDEPESCAFYMDGNGWVGSDALPALSIESRRPFKQLAGSQFSYGNIVAAGRGCLVASATEEQTNAASTKRSDEERNQRLEAEKQQQVRSGEEFRQARLAQAEADEARKEQEKEAAQVARVTREADLWSKARLIECSKPKTVDSCDGAELYAKEFPDGSHAAEVRQALAAGADRLTALKKAEEARQQTLKKAEEAKQRAQDKKDARESCVRACRQKYETAKPGFYEVLVNRCVANGC
ncbi:MAG: hypothetical protein EOO70_03075 [Myxococcaceae bacterium]|nr:MAG: hypothetical protein EOO70_03075 [Myxococcaceae bacterium]